MELSGRTVVLLCCPAVLLSWSFPKHVAARGGRRFGNSVRRSDFDVWKSLNCSVRFARTPRILQTDPFPLSSLKGEVVDD